MGRKKIFDSGDTHIETVEVKTERPEGTDAVEKQSKIKNQAVSIRSLFQYGTFIELFYLFIGIIASAVYGVSFPLALLVFGDAINSYIEGTSHLCSLNLTALSEKYCPPNITITPGNFYTTMPLCHFNGTSLANVNFSLEDATRKPLMMSIIIGCVSLLSAYIRVTFSSISAERQVRTIRKKLFQSILEKDVAFFDQHQTGQLTQHFTDSINKIGKGIGEKLTAAIEMIATFISCFVVGFIRGWKLSLVIVSVAPLIFIPIVVLFALIKKMTAIELEAYGRAGVIAEEVISSIRTVLSYNGQQKEIQRYEKHLDKARISGIKKSFIGGIRMSITYFLIFSIYALGFWYGTKLVWEDNYSIGVVFTVFIAINFGMVYLAEASPHIQAIYDARVAAYAVWNIISEPVTINKNSGLDSHQENFLGHIQFSNVYFCYPSRPDVPILTNLSFDVQPGQTIALVGSSGSGKSTCIQLLERFYDPHFGSISIDQTNITEYNLSWLRERIGVVSQEPVLFHGTIRENILFGLDSATDEQIFQAAQMANAHDFIMKLPNKYDTEVGERGVALSGGQKQRIAIARALLPNPQILLLDEATSALDSESEKLVQEALNRAAQGRTTIVVAHRLSTIRHADQIIVMEKGGIVEQGDHKTLMKMKGAYFNLVEQQILHQIEQTEELGSEHEGKKKKTSSNNKKHHHHHKTVDTNDTAPTPDETYLEKPVQSISDLTAMDEKIKKKKRNITLSILKMNKPEWISLTIGCLVSCLGGAREPGSLLIQAKLAIVFQECDVHVQKQQVPIYIFLYIGLAVMSLILHSIQGYAFGRSGEAMTKRLRSKAFQSILRQDITYFDQKEHSTGALCTRLATEASAVQGASGVRMGLIIQYLCSMIIGLIIGFVYSWQLTFLMLVFLPFILFGGILQIQLASRFANKDKPIFEDAGQVTLESIENIRTVFQLTKEIHFFGRYSRILDQIYQSSLKRTHIMSAVYSISSSMFYFGLAAFISLFTHLIENGTITFQNGFMVLNCVVLTARAIGRALNLFPDYGEALAAAENIFQLLDRQPTIDNQSNDGNQIENFSGELHFDGVYFAYPNRAESTILQNFQLHIEPGQKVALVGPSGCGKSTIIQLIERFYDVDEGRLLIDSQDVRNVDLHWYRSQIGIVSQEPVLFDVSITENIAYGDNSRKNIPLDEIIRAAKDANIHDFIQSLPQGYETVCGAKGVQLSGGQKQRIAIARALIANPKILLLDEATSALDSENEQIVQEALDRAQQNRTSITIAHRLTTIQNADIIYVFHHGMIVESGNHEELMTLRGRYYRLVQQKLK